jgi:prepilin-type N-terminal cleavage/methylation domain-containing protein
VIERILIRILADARQDISPPPGGRWRGGLCAQLASDRGFTLHEVLVAIVISSLMIGFGLSLFLFAQKLLVAHERSSHLRATVDRVLDVLSSDIERSCEVNEVTDTTIVLRLPNRRAATYRHNGAEIFRNGDLMHNEGMHLALTIKGLPPPTGVKFSSPAFEIGVVGKETGMSYEAQTVVLVPWSARQEFTGSSSRVP